MQFGLSFVALLEIYAVADYQRAQKFLTPPCPPCLKCHDGVRTICDSHRFLTRDIFLRKNSQKVC